MSYNPNTDPGALPPSEYIIPVQGIDYLPQLISTVNNHGYARFNNVHTSDALLALSHTLGEVSVHSMTDDLGVTTLTTLPDVSANAGGVYKPDYELMPHTDGSAMERPSSLIVLSCPNPDATGGGASMMSDGRLVFDELAATDPELLEALQHPDAATFGERGQFTGAVFARGDDGATRIRFRYDDQVTFNHVPRQRLKPLLDIIARNEVRFSLGAGEGYVIDNTRMLHGRTRITGLRTVIRTHVEPFTGQDVPEDQHFKLGF